MQSRKLAAGAGALALTLSTMTTTNAWADVSTEKAQQLVEQCREKTVQSPEGEKLTGNPLKAEHNAKGYEPGEPYELLINFTGHGNTVHNIICQVDEQGNVSFKGADQSGSAKKL